MGLYHFCPHFSSCFPAPQQAFVGEMGQKRRLVAASSYVFEKGRNFSKQVGRWDPRSRPRAGKRKIHAPAAGRKTKNPQPGRGRENKIPAARPRADIKYGFEV